MIPNLAVVVTSMNLKDITLACVDSLVRAGLRADQIIVVDNGSNDGTVPALADAYPSLALIVNSENVGYSGACNQGFELAIQHGADWILQLNNDTEVAPDFFEKLGQAVARYPQYRLFHPAIMYYEDPEVIWHIGARRVPGTLIFREPFKNKPYDPNWPEVMPIDLMASCAMLAHREVYQRVGPMEARLVIYWDDLDFVWRANRAGFKMAAAPKAKMWHKVSRTMGRARPRQRYLNIRNQVRFYRVHAHGLQKPLMLGFAAYKSTITILGDLRSRQTELIKPIFEGWRDAFRSL